jgi:hypothetical protein
MGGGGCPERESNGSAAKRDERCAAVSRTSKRSSIDLWRDSPDAPRHAEVFGRRRQQAKRKRAIMPPIEARTGDLPMIKDPD